MWIATLDAFAVEIGPATPAVAAVVLNWNSAEDSIACIESLLSLHQEVGIYLCDNASSDGSMQRFREWECDKLPALNADRIARGRPTTIFRDLSDTRGSFAPLPTGQISRLSLIQTGANLGYAGGNNVGIRQALRDGYDYIWILNNDTEVEPDAVTWLLRRMAGDPKIGICGSTLVYFDRRNLIQTLGGSDFDALKGKSKPIGSFHEAGAPIDAAAVEARLKYISGAAAMVSRSFVEDVGLMQEDYFLYGEELDWSMRAKGRFKLAYAPQSIVYHKVGSSIGTNDFGGNSPLADYYLTRNRIRVCARFSKVSLPFVYLEVLRDIAHRGIRGSRARAVAVLRAAIGLPYRSHA